MWLKGAGRTSRTGRKVICTVSLVLVLCLLCGGTALAKLLLKKGSRGADVVTVQEELQNAGYKVSVDGIFGDETYHAVLDFQRAHKLKVKRGVSVIPILVYEGHLSKRIPADGYFARVISAEDLMGRN